MRKKSTHGLGIFVLAVVKTHGRVYGVSMIITQGMTVTAYEYFKSVKTGGSWERKP